MSIDLIIVMGVSGSGKSTVAKFLANNHEYKFIEADDYHSDSNIEHMAQGKALTNDMREPWITSLIQEVITSNTHKQHCVMSFSGLQYKHRKRFHDLPVNVLFIHLHGSKQVIKERMELRNHFMPSVLLDSQFEALQEAQRNENLFQVDINQCKNKVINDALKIVIDWQKKR